MAILSNGEVLMAWPVTNHRITAGWYYSDMSLHRALDFGVSFVPAFCALKGKVIRKYIWNGKVTSGDTNSYGNFIIIQHDNYNGKTLKTLYAHLDSIAVDVGDYVEEGQLIGVTGATGNVNGAHLHFEVRLNDERVNPLNWLDDDFYKAYDYVQLGEYSSVKRNVNNGGETVNKLQSMCVVGDCPDTIEKAKALGLKVEQVTAYKIGPASNGDCMTVWASSEAEGCDYYSKYVGG